MAAQLDMFDSGTYVVWDLDNKERTLELFSIKAEADEYEQELEEAGSETCFRHVPYPQKEVSDIIDQLMY